MIKKQYIDKLKQLVLHQLGEQPVKLFIYGSSLERDNFRDVDLGIEGEVTEQQIIELKDQLEESEFPYNIDVVNFNKTTADFKKAVFDSKILWIKN